MKENNFQIKEWEDNKFIPFRLEKEMSWLSCGLCGGYGQHKEYDMTWECSCCSGGAGVG